MMDFFSGQGVFCRRISKLWPVIVAVSLLTSPTYSFAADSVLAKNYFPLDIGLEWKGTVYRYKNLGTYKINNITTIKHASDWWVGNDNKIDPWKEAGYDCYTNDQNGLRVHAVGEQGNDMVFLSPVKILNSVVSPGDVLINTLPEIDKGLSVIYTVLSVSETVTVPAGTYQNCIKLAEEVNNDSGCGSMNEKKHVWLALGVGKVKVDNFTNTDCGFFWESEELLQAPQTGKPPIPEIQATNNGPAGPVSVTISLTPGSKQGQKADYWIAANTPFGLKFLTMGQSGLAWGDKMKPCLKSQMIEFKSFPLPEPPFSQGTNQVYFAVDDNADGILDATWWDYDEVNIK